MRKGYCHCQSYATASRRVGSSSRSLSWQPPAAHVSLATYRGSSATTA